MQIGVTMYWPIALMTSMSTLHSFGFLGLGFLFQHPQETVCPLFKSVRRAVFFVPQSH